MLGMAEGMVESDVYVSKLGCLGITDMFTDCYLSMTSVPLITDDHDKYIFGLLRCFTPLFLFLLSSFRPWR